MLSARDRQRKLFLRRQTLRMRRLSSQLSQSNASAPQKPGTTDLIWTRDGPTTLEANAQRAMAYHDALPENLRTKAKDRQDFDIETSYTKLMPGSPIPGDVEDA